MDELTNVNASLLALRPAEESAAHRVPLMLRRRTVPIPDPYPSINPAQPALACTALAPVIEPWPCSGESLAGSRPSSRAVTKAARAPDVRRRTGQSLDLSADMPDPPPGTLLRRPRRARLRRLHYVKTVRPTTIARGRTPRSSSRDKRVISTSPACRSDPNFLVPEPRPISLSFTSTRCHGSTIRREPTLTTRAAALLGNTAASVANNLDPHPDRRSHATVPDTNHRLIPFTWACRAFPSPSNPTALFVSRAGLERLIVNTSRATRPPDLWSACSPSLRPKVRSLPGSPSRPCPYQTLQDLPITGLTIRRNRRPLPATHPPYRAGEHLPSARGGHKKKKSSSVRTRSSRSKSILRRGHQ